MDYQTIHPSNGYGSVTPPNYSDREIELAVRQIGSKGMPFLMHLYRTSADSARLERRVAKLPRLLQFHWIDHLAKRQEQYGRRNLAMAYVGFGILGTNALSALPELSERFREAKNGTDVFVAARLISFMGQPGFDYVIHQIATNQSTMHRLFASVAIYNANTAAINVSEAASVLMNLTNATNAVLARTATEALRHVQSNGQPTNAVAR